MSGGSLQLHEYPVDVVRLSCKMRAGRTLSTGMTTHSCV